MRKTQEGWQLAAFGIVLAIVVVAGAIYIATNGGKVNPAQELEGAMTSEVHDPDPGTNDDCEKRPDCFH